MSKHLDWSRITPDVAIWCQTAEEDKAFRTECEGRGMTWSSGKKPLEVTYFEEEFGFKYNIDGYMIIGFHAANSVPYSSLLVEGKPAKSRLAEILGVEDDEEWEWGGNTYRIHDGKRQYKDNDIWGESVSEWHLWNIINHTDLIIRKPRFTHDELAMLRCFAAAGVTHIVREQTGKLRACEGSADKTPIDSSWIELGSVWAAKGHGMKETLLPSIRPGESIELSEVLK